MRGHHEYILHDCDHRHPATLIQPNLSNFTPNIHSAELLFLMHQELYYCKQHRLHEAKHNSINRQVSKQEHLYGAVRP